MVTWTREAESPDEARFAVAHVGLWEFAVDAACLEWSSTTARLHGVGPDAAPLSLADFARALGASDREEAVSALLEAARQPGRSVAFSYTWVVSGEPRYMRVCCVAERHEGGEGGEVARFVGTVQDVTADRRAQLELLRASAATEAASRVRSQFLATMSHEIRTPLNAVLGMTALVLDTELTPTQREYLAAAKSSGEALLALVNDVLDLSKLDAGKLVLEERPFGVRDVVGDVIQCLAPAAAAKGIGLVADVSASVPTASTGDALRVRQILTNLVANAVKFTPAGAVSVRAEQDGDVLRLFVHDTGIGIPPASQGLIFEAFRQGDGTTTRRFGGTGLGLGIASELAQRMRGTITVKSEVGRGSEFAVAIHVPPASPAAEACPAPAVPQAPGPVADAGCRRKLRVLVAEDDDTNAMLAMALIRRMGHTGVRVRDGAEAVEAAWAEPWDVILMDVHMPVLDGLEATARIRARESERGGHVAIVAVTANAMKGDEDRCIAVGMDAYVSKPVHPAALEAALVRCLARVR